MYNNEYKDCTSVKSRLHQYFIHGHTVDCNNWFEDYSLCLKWRNNKDLHAAVIHFHNILTNIIVEAIFDF